MSNNEPSMVRVMVILAVAVMAVYGAVVVYAQQRPQIIGGNPVTIILTPAHQCGIPTRQAT